MEQAEWLALFAQLDETGWECLSDWNRAAHSTAERKFLALVKDIQQVLGEQCIIEHGGQIQDASFHGLPAIPQSCLLQDYIISLRVSNFGSLATLYDDDEVVIPSCRDTIKATLKRHGYIYVPSRILREAYYDLHIGIPNWGGRFFYYL